MSNSKKGSRTSAADDQDQSVKEHTEVEAAVRTEKFSIWSLCGIALATGESWLALGNSLSLALYNGGSAGVLYGFIAASACYWIVAASIAELASAMPNTATVYHWARVTGGRRWGEPCSWLSGWWGFAAYQCAVASLVSFMALQTLGIYSVLHPEFDAQGWHICISYLACNWTMCLVVLFGDKWLATVESFGLLFTTCGWLISIIICAVMPSVNGRGYASSKNVWTGWENQTGWSSNGFVFCLGMLNAAFAVCGKLKACSNAKIELLTVMAHVAPDIPAHLAEEIPNPRRNVPRVILLQYIASFLTGFAFLVTLFYANPDLQATTSQRSVFPLSLLYIQATSRHATVGLLCLCLLNTLMGVLGVYAIAGRQAWALARGGATPCARFFGKLDDKTQAPFRTTAFVGVLSTCLGCLYLGSQQAFQAITGSFVVFLSLAYLGALLPHLLSGRRNTGQGPFWMPEPVGLIVNTLSCVYLLTFGVIFLFPSNMPVTAGNMNYTVVIVSGWTLVALLWRVMRPR